MLLKKKQRGPDFMKHGVDNTVKENSSVFFLPSPNALVAVSKGMRAVKLCTNAG